VAWPSVSSPLARIAPPVSRNPTALPRTATCSTARTDFYKQGVKANVLFFDKRPGRPEPWTKELWIYDFRTNQSFTLKERPLKRAHLDEFVAGARLAERHKRVESERFRRFAYGDLVKRDKLNLDIFWLKDAGLDDPDTLPPPDEIAAEIVESLEAALQRFRSVAARSS